MEKLRVLDVGCGKYPLILKDFAVVHVDTSEGTHLEVKCDAHYLPFRDKSFRIVYASHVLEHCIDPLMVLREFERVCDGFAVVKVPNALNYARFREPNHYYSWSWSTFENLLRLVFSSVSITPAIRVEKSRNKIRNLVKKLQIYILATLFGKNELIAVCRI